MVRGYRIKDQSTSFYISGAFNGSMALDSTGGHEAINGEILEVQWKTATLGSLALTFGKSQEEFFRRNAPSGANYQVARPFVFVGNSAGSIASATMYPYVSNDVLWVNLGSAASGAAVNEIVVRYR